MTAAATRPCLLIAAGLAADPDLPELSRSLRLRGAAHRLLAEAPTPRSLLAALRAEDADPARSWLATADATAVAAAATAGLAGVVLVGGPGPADRDDGVVVRHAERLAAAPLAMVPRGGGCWHDR